MPDGFNSPCCSSCKWSTAVEQTRTNAVFCGLHQMQIHYAAAMFCQDLSHDKFPELAAFIEAHPIESNMLYEWISGASDGGWYAYFPGYAGSYYPLATFQDYQPVSSEVIVEVVKANRKHRLSNTGD